MTNTKKCGSHRKTPVKRAKKVEEGRIKTKSSGLCFSTSTAHLNFNVFYSFTHFWGSRLLKLWFENSNIKLYRR